jgi:phosphoglycerate dehydrogenase-like enzyme
MALIAALPEFLEIQPPEGVEVRPVPLLSPWPKQVLEAEFLVLSPSMREAFLLHLPEMSRLRYLQSTTAGVDWIPKDLTPRITLLDASGVYDIPVAEWIVSGILLVLKRWTDFWEKQKQGVWIPNPLEELHGKTLLLLGYGSIGRALEERLKPFGVRFIRVARRPREGVFGPEDLPSLLPQAEILVVLLPLTRETRGLISAEFLDLLPPRP